jgi:hypothetical protein
MKHLLVLLLLISVGLQGQTKYQGDTVSLAFDDELIAGPPENASFSGYAVRTGETWSAVIFDPSLKVVARGSYSSKRCRTREGWFTFYYPDGKRAASGQYHQDKKQGFWRTWYASGKVRDSLHYDRDNPAGPYFSYFESGRLSGRGQFTNGLEDSSWTWFHANGSISSVEEFSKGTLKGQRCMDTTGRIQLENCKLYAEPMTIENETIWQLVYKDLVLPKDNSGRLIEGNVTVDVLITESGELRQLKVVRSEHPELDAIVMKALAEKKLWRPAYNHNRPVVYERSLVIPINSKPGLVSQHSANRGNDYPGDLRSPRLASYYWNMDNAGYIREY